MKIVKILGGLGNQMFQYALYLSLRKKFPNEEIKVDCSYFKTYHVHTGLELDRVFGLDLPQATFRELLKVTWPVYSFKLSRAIHKTLPPRGTECWEAKDYTYNTDVFTEGNKYYDGYWQNFHYFDEYKDVIFDKFRFILPINTQSKIMLQHLEGTINSISIHVRRGDYLRAKNYAGLCEKEYYKKSIEHIMSNIKKPFFYIFSDDMEWCKINIIPMLNASNVILVDWNKGKDSPIDMMLMSKCNHNIIANSSFSWWAAYLNRYKDKIVCAPSKWTNTKVNCRFQLPEWILF